LSIKSYDYVTMKVRLLFSVIYKQVIKSTTMEAA